jgi:dTDP-4-dehydrorhamnose 3,5-epimerase
VNVIRERLAGLLTVELDCFADNRGFFVERFSERRFAEAGLPTSFCQDNHSRSAPGVVRGLHFQTDPAQGKLVGVVRGRIWDVVVDIRPDSPTFGEHLGAELSDVNSRLLWIPAGFAHGFCVIGDEPADVLYKVDNPYLSASESGILWSDPDLGIDWPVLDPIVSARDRQLPSFADCRRRLGR